MKRTSKIAVLAMASATAASLALSVTTATAKPPTPPPTEVTISGTVGEDVSTTDFYDGRHLRYVGDPAPDGYGDYYQWGGPAILTASPEDGPVSMSGTLDLADMTTKDQVAVIGLHDADALRAGDRGEKAEVGVYVARRADGYRIGVTDGDAGGGEFVQRFQDFPFASLVDGVVEIEFMVDGTAEPATCASAPGDVPTADGCMTLTVNGGAPLTDSYGTIVPTDIPIETELGNGAVPGWYSAYPSGFGPNVGVDFDLTIGPLATPRTAADCKQGGYASYGFQNQGQCVSSLKTNEKAGKK
ncbi:hypothetical protein GCM10027020_34570 [Nocardioides salsibiostraticola]